MIKIFLKSIIQYILLCIYPSYYEIKTIIRTSSSGSFIEYNSNDE